MKNLSIYEVSEKNLNLPSKDDVAVFCYGYSEGRSAGKLSTCSYNLVVTNYNENDEETWKKDLSDVSGFHASPDNFPVNITFVTFNNVLCVGLSKGELFTISDSGNSCDLAGFCDNGLLAMEWSPDQELLVLVNKEHNAILTSCTFDAINEVNLLSEEFGEKQFITVGWGAKETQFHGREGKQAAKAKNDFSSDLNTTDDAVKITWRGDGQFYAVGFNVEGFRRFKVFDREGNLQYTSEKQPGLEANLVWRPSGNVIASTQKLPDQYVVAFFEKNGLKHGGFTLPVGKETTVEDMSWSTDSEVIALTCLDTADNTQKILIFTTSNYHWYLKQTLSFGTEKVSKIIWDNDFDVRNNKKFHVILRNGQHYCYNWIWDINHSGGTRDDDDAIVAVIDGKKVLVTGFRQTVVPPPMSATEIVLESQVNSIHFSPVKHGNESNNFFVCTTESMLVFFRQTNKFPLKYEQTSIVSFDGYKFPFQFFNWQWVNENTVICIQNDSNKYNILEYQLNKNSMEIKATTLLPACVTRTNLHPKDSKKLFLLLSNGEIIEYNSGGEITPADVTFPTSCPKVNVISIDNNTHFLGLSHKGNFYVDNSLTLSNVSSFFVHTHFLLVTTLKHVILCLELNEAGLNVMKEYKTTESPQVYKRKIERGSKLVIAVPNDTRTVLQMPRGNLEAIQPRPLSLKIIGSYLDNLKYFEAFDLMRKQRINLNLIYDHDPVKFMSNVDVFLENIKNNTWLNIFLCDLENIDVTNTMYSSSYLSSNRPNSNVDGKIEKVCDVIREHITKREDSDVKVLPLLTTYVKKNNNIELEKALEIVQKIKDRETNGAKPPVSSDEALKYLLYMVDVDTLFNVALGTYNFDLVLLVANKSQKDPKEYIPMLNEFNEMEENYRRFSINKHLKRFDRAIKSLVKCGVEKYDELRNFVKFHSLYKKALDLFKPDEEIFQQISEDFGSYLRLKKQFAEAGIIYRRSKNNKKAIECFKDALEWELALELAHGWSKEELKKLCSDLINGLKDEKRYKEALTILEQYNEENEETILYAVDFGQYRTALRLCSKYNREDLKENRVEPALQDEYKNLNELIENNWSTFIRHKERLRVVRENKRNNPVEQYDAAFANKDSDLYSDAGSTVASSASRGSSRTHRSSKNRRKHERKVASLKEGSQYEDVALVMALHNLVTSSFELRCQVKEVNIALSCFGRDTEALGLQKCLDKLLRDMRESFKEIWTNELVLEATNAAIAALDVPEGCSVLPQGIATLEPHLRIAPVIEEIKWKLEGLD